MNVYSWRVKWRRRILVVEDEPLVSSLLCEALTTAHFDAHACADAVSARAAVDEVDPDAALIDIQLGTGPTGIHFGQWLHACHPQVAQIYLTRHVDPKASGLEAWDVPEGSTFLAKDRITRVDSLILAIEGALQQSADPTRHDLDNRSMLSQLTSTQREILRLAAAGLTNAAIAALRGTTERTVEQRMQAVYEALGVSMASDMNPRVQATRIFFESGGVLTPEDATT